MAIYRTIQLSFWTDNKVVDDFTPEDKYFYLYLFTNPQTNLCGCYEVSLKTMSDQTGYTKDTIERLLDRFEQVHNVIKYSKKTKELFLLNWYKYNWQGGNQIKCLENEMAQVKNADFKAELIGILNEKFFGDKPLTSPLQANCLEATVTVTDNNTDSNNKDNYIDSIRIVIDYFNQVVGTKYTYKNKANNEHIRARLKDGFSVDDMKLVIDDKAKKWGKDEKMKAFLRPKTLFAPSHFEDYLNEAMMGSGSGSSKPKSDWDGLAERLDKEAKDGLSSMNYEDYGDFK